MNLIEQHMENVSREEAQLEERQVFLKSEQAETRKLLGNIRRYRKSLQKQYPSSQATLPLVPPDDEEEEATDEPLDPDGGEPLVPGEWSPDYEVPAEPTEADTPAKEWEPSYFGEPAPPAEPAPVEVEKPTRRRKAKAFAEE